MFSFCVFVYASTVDDESFTVTGVVGSEGEGCFSVYVSKVLHSHRSCRLRGRGLFFSIEVWRHSHLILFVC